MQQLAGVLVFGITTPSANVLQYLVTNDNSFINWGVFLVLGIFAGSFIAAKASNEFRVRAGCANLRSQCGSAVC